MTLKVLHNVFLTELLPLCSFCIVEIFVTSYSTVEQFAVDSAADSRRKGLLKTLLTHLSMILCWGLMA